jgi:hypothetical protein
LTGLIILSAENDVALELDYAETLSYLVPEKSEKDVFMGSENFTYTYQ